MGKKYIYNWDVVAKAVEGVKHYKEMQHMYRRYMGAQGDSQVTVSSTKTTDTGKLVAELLSPQSFPSTSKV